MHCFHCFLIAFSLLLIYIFLIVHAVNKLYVKTTMNRFILLLIVCFKIFGVNLLRNGAVCSLSEIVFRASDDDGYFQKI